MAGGNDFASIFSSAMQTPEKPVEGGEFTSPLPPPGGAGFSSVRAGDPDRISGVTKYDFNIRRRVFLVYRPWEKCQRCLDDVANNSVVLPATGDIDCPHNELKAYEEVVNKILDGKYLFGSETEIPNKDGTVAVSLRWYEPKPRTRQRADASSTS